MCSELLPTFTRVCGLAQDRGIEALDLVNFSVVSSVGVSELVLCVSCFQAKLALLILSLMMIDR
jgi:hypothetical protein